MPLPYNNMNKVLVLSYHYPPCAYGCSIRVVNFVKFLPAFGFKPVVLTVEPDYYKDHAADDSSHESAMPADIEVLRTASLEPRAKMGAGLASNSHQNPGRPAKIKSAALRAVQQLGDSLLVPDVQILWAPAALKAGRELLTRPDIKLIFAVAPPFSVLIVAYWLKRLTGKKLVLDFKDMWVGRNQHEHRTRLCSLFSKQIEKRIVNAADRVILNTDGSYRHFVARYPRHKEKFLLIPNGFEPQLEDLVKQSSPELNEQPKSFKIVHTGTVDTDRNPQTFIYAVRKLCDEQPEFAAQVKISFSGKVHHTYIALVEELGLNNIFDFLGYVNYNQNIQLLCSASLLLLLTTHDAPDAIPGKLYEYLAIKKTILAITEDGAARDLLRSLKAGKAFYPTDKAGIKQALWDSYRAFCKGELTAPEIALKKYNRQHQTGQLAQAFNQLLD